MHFYKLATLIIINYNLSVTNNILIILEAFANILVFVYEFHLTFSRKQMLLKISMQPLSFIFFSQ